MGRYISKRTIFAAAIALAVLSAIAVGVSRTRRHASNNEVELRRSRIPATVLWAWERPTDLRFIDPNRVGVAFLARTIRLRRDEVIIKPRFQPLNLPEQTKVIAVVRVESDGEEKPLLTSNQARQLVDGIQAVANLPNVLAVQIDFDAIRSEREFYRNVVVEVRRRLPPSIGFSITALASWCGDDDWISDLPVDEAVPMLFRMGPDRQVMKNRLSAQEEFSAKPCRSSYGVSTDEPLDGLRPEKRVYVFNPQAWTEQSVRAVLESRK
jgi:hypothetical protein